jgi:predicted transcriptional regulator
MARIGLTPAQCRAARNAVGLSQKKLAEEAEVSLPVVQEFEGRAGRIPMEKNLRDMRDVLGRYGVQFQVVEGGRAAVIFADKDAQPAPSQRAETADAG